MFKNPGNQKVSADLCHSRGADGGVHPSEVPWSRGGLRVEGLGFRVYVGSGFRVDISEGLEFLGGYGFRV